MTPQACPSHPMFQVESSLAANRLSTAGMDLAPRAVVKACTVSEFAIRSVYSQSLMYRSPSYNFSIVFPSSNVVPAENVTTE
jgi:hypothetical protein